MPRKRDALVGKGEWPERLCKGAAQTRKGLRNVFPNRILLQKQFLVTADNLSSSRSTATKTVFSDS
jgi:hypothetical protein